MKLPHSIKSIFAAFIAVLMLAPVFATSVSAGVPADLLSYPLCISAFGSDVVVGPFSSEQEAIDKEILTWDPEDGRYELPTNTEQVPCPSTDPDPGAQPAPIVVYGDWTGGEATCDVTSVTQSRTVTTTSFVLSTDGSQWVQGQPVVTTETRVDTLTAEEAAACQPDNENPGGGNNDTRKVYVCHWTPGQDGKYVLIEVSVNAADENPNLQGHAGHEDDLIGDQYANGCPVVTPEPTEPVVTPTPTEPVVNPTPTEPVVNPTPTEPVVNPTPTEPVVNPTPTEPVVNPPSGEQPPAAPPAVETPQKPTIPVVFMPNPAAEPTPVPTVPTVTTPPNTGTGFGLTSESTLQLWQVVAVGGVLCAGAAVIVRRKEQIA